MAGTISNCNTVGPCEDYIALTQGWRKITRLPPEETGAGLNCDSNLKVRLIRMRRSYSQHSNFLTTIFSSEDKTSCTKYFFTILNRTEETETNY